MHSIYLPRRHTKRGLSLLFVIFFFLFSLSIRARDIATEEPLPTPETTPAASDVLPTESPDETPIPDVTPSQEATLEPSPVTAIPYVTADPTQEATLIVPRSR